MTLESTAAHLLLLAEAMSESMLLPAGVLVLGFLAAISFARPKHLERAAPVAPA